MGGDVLKNKLYFLLLAFLLVFVLVSCNAPASTQASESTPSASDWPTGLSEMIGNQVIAINDRDSQSYLRTINPNNVVFYAESEYFAQKLAQANFSDFEKKVLSVQKMTDELYIAEIEQSYQQNGQVNKTVYKMRCLFENDLWLDDDVAFDAQMIHQLKLLTMEGVEDPERFYLDVKKSLENVETTFPEPLTGLIEIKLYSDQELLRQTTDLGIEWLFTGWSEANHAIKAFTGQPAPYNYEGLFTHELIHKLTLTVSNSNLPLWFAEGLATHYGSNAVAGGTYIDMGKSNADDMRLSPLDLQKINLEVLDSREAVMAYYGASAMIVQYLSETYGDEKVFELYQALGGYPLNDINSNHHYAVADQRMEEVLLKVLNLNSEGLSKAYMLWYNDQYPE